MSKRIPPPITFTGLRAAIDKIGFSYHTTFTKQRWDELMNELAMSSGLALRIKDEDGEVTKYVLEPANNANRIQQGTLVLSDRHHFLRIIVTAPFAARVARAQDPYRCVLVEINGSLFSTQTTGVALVRKVRRAIEALFFPDRGSTAKARRLALASSVVPTALHLCADVAIGGRKGTRWIHDSLFAGGNVEEVAGDWPKRAERRGSLAGTDGPGFTFNIRGRIARMNVYERDKSLVPKRKRRVREDYERVLRELGWDGTSRVIRVEWQFKRSWLLSQEFNYADGGKRRGRDLTLDEFLRNLPAVGDALAKRYRHTEPGATGRRDHRPESRFWLAVRKALKTLPIPDPESTPVATVTSRATAATTASRFHRAAGLFKQLAETGGPNGAPMDPDDLAVLITAEARTRRNAPTPRSTNFARATAPTTSTKSPAAPKKSPTATKPNAASGTPKSRSSKGSK